MYVYIIIIICLYYLYRIYKMEYTSTSKIAIWCLKWHNKQLEYNIMQNTILKEI